jgi:hypothetical protein
MWTPYGCILLLQYIQQTLCEVQPMSNILVTPKNPALLALVAKAQQASAKTGEEKQAAQDFVDLPLTQDNYTVTCGGSLTQDHYHIEGSMEELLANINSAFRAWRRSDTCEDTYRWSSVLGVVDNTIIFYTESYYDSPGMNYYTVSYSVGDDQAVSIGSDVQPANVKLVVEALGLATVNTVEGTQSTGEEQTAMRKDEKDKQQTQDTVPDTTPVADIVAAATPANKTNPSLEGDEKKTDAETPGAKVTDDPGDDPAGTPTPDFDGDEKVSTAAPDGGTTDAVRKAMGKTAAGTKQDAQEAFDASKLLQGDSYDYGKLPLSYIQAATTEESNGSKLMHIQGIVTRGDIVNSKGEVYPTAVWEQNLPKMNQSAKAGKFLGKVEHPDAEQGLVDAAIKFDEFWLQGDDLWAKATVIPTEPYGKNLQAMIEAGVQVDFSSRGYGSKITQDWRGVQRPVIQNDFVCTAFDAVWHGASTGSGVKSVEYQSDMNPTTTTTSKGDAPVEENKTQTQSAVEVKAAEIRAKAELKQTRVALLDSANLTEVGMKAYQNALDSCTDLTSLIQTSENLLPHLQATFAKSEEAATVETQSETYMPHFFVKQSKEETAPKTVGEMFTRMVQDLPDGPARPGIPNYFTSPRKACYQMLCNVAREHQGAFDGGQAALGLLALEQGKIDRAKDILEQSLPTGGTIANGNADGDGAPLSNYLIFPLIRRVYPMYVVNEIASTQPMDRPEGKIFYLDHYRVDGSANERRLDLNTSSNPFTSSFGDNSTEGSAALQIRLRLASVLVQAHTKKLGATWSIEEMQDLRAYHNLDAAQELLGGIAREMALEWNMEVLNDMLAQATAAALTFGTTMPASGFTQQKDWDEYIWNYIQKLDNMIFSKRNGPMTHIVCGVDAALAMAKSMRGAFTIGGGEGNATDMEVYPGTTFYGTVNTPNGSRYKVMKTNFWGSGTANGSKILGIRKGTEWNDTPYIWAPYTDYVTPMLTDPSDFSQKQGVVSRAAKKVVVSDAMGYINVTNAQGTIL